MRSILVLSLFACSISLAAAQTALTPLVIDSQTAEQHLLPHPGPAIAPLALAAHVFGDVVTQVGIDPSGHVVWAIVLSGPPMLQGQAMDDSFNLLFTPFTQNAQNVYATALVKTSYGPNTPLPRYTKEVPVHEYSSPLSSALYECNQAESGKANPQQIAKRCKGIVKAADETKDTYQDRRIKAYIRASDAFFRNNQFDDALAAADKAVALAMPGHIDNANLALAYASRAQAEASLKNLSAADGDLTQAEQAEHAAIAIIQSSDFRTSYTTTLQGFLRLHAEVLTAMGNTQAAQTKTDEAAKL